MQLLLTFKIWILLVKNFYFYYSFFTLISQSNEVGKDSIDVVKIKKSNLSMIYNIYHHPLKNKIKNNKNNLNKILII